MFRSRARLPFAVCPLLALAIVACGGGDSSSPTSPTASTPTVTALTISGNAGTLNRPQQSVQLTATAALSNGTTRDVTGAANWRSDNTSVATVTAGGSVTAVNDGEATIIATYEGVQATTRVRVAIPRRAEPRVTGEITVRPSPEPLFLFRAQVELTYSELSRAVGMNVNFVNVTWRDYRGDLLIFRNYHPGDLQGIWGTNHIGAGEERGLIARIDYNRPISSVSVLVETSVQDDYGNVINFSDTFTSSVGLTAPSILPGAIDMFRPPVFVP